MTFHRARPLVRRDEKPRDAIRLRAPTAFRPCHAGLILVCIFLFVDFLRHGGPEITDEPPHVGELGRGQAPVVSGREVDVGDSSCRNASIAFRDGIVCSLRGIGKPLVRFPTPMTVAPTSATCGRMAR